MTFDIAALDTQTKSDAGSKMELVHPKTRNPILDDAGQPVTITLLGNNSEIFRDVQRRVTDRRTARAAKGVRATTDDIRNEDFEVLVACTTDWTIPLMDGQPFAYSRENARKLWADRRFESVFRAAVSFIMEDGNFLADSSGA